MATIGTLLIELSANVARLEADLGKASRHVQNTERMIQQSVGRMNQVFGLLGFTITGAGMVTFVKHSIDAQDELATLAERTGTAVEELAGLKYAAEQNSTSLEAVANAGKKLSVTMVDKPELFKKLGINAKTSTEAMVQMADLFANMPDGIEKTALAVKLMGKNGEEMIPFLNQGSASLRGFIERGKELIPVTTESAARAKEFNDQLNTLKTSVGGLGMGLANELLKPMSATVVELNKMSESGGNFLPVGAAIRTVFETFVVLGANTGYVFKQVGNEIGGIAAQLVALASGDFKGASNIGKMMREDAERARKEIDAFSERILNPLVAPDKKPATTDKPKTVSKNIKDILAGDQTKNSTDGMQVLKALELDYQNTLSKRAEAMNYPLMSASERALAEDLRTVHADAAKSRVELEKLNVSGRLSATDYKSRLQELQAEEDAQVEAITRMRGAQDELNRSWQFGAKTAIRSYLDEVENVAKQSEAMFGRAFKGMEDALVSFVRTGKLDFKSLTDSIIADILRISIRQSVTGPLAGLVGGLFGGGGGATASAQSMSGAQVNMGGYQSITGSLISGTRAAGGPVDGGSTYLVGERGPELFTPPQSGRIVPNNKLGGSSTQITYAPIINIDARTDQAEVHRLVSNAVKQGNAELFDSMRRQGVI